MTAQHGPESGRIHRLTRRLADARQRASMARSYGDESGYRYCMDEVRRLRAALEG